MSIISEKISKYETYIGNLEVNAGQLNPMSLRYEGAMAKLQCYKEMLSDLKQIQSRNNASPVSTEFEVKKPS